jgi:phospholipid-transporting ATPase
MEAHIGVGIYGEEGMRAVQSSDYAIGEFRILHSLLLFHGRTNYIRNAECVLYFFYKNFVFTILQFFFGFYCNFTGQTIIDDWFITLFNLLFTSLPLGVRALLDHDVKPDDSEIVYLMLPFLYLENRKNPVFTITNFIIYLLKGTVHSLINFFWVIYYLDESINKNGNMGGLWLCSVNLFSNILLIVSIDLLIYTKFHTWINLVFLLVVTFLSYIIFLILVHHMSMFNSVGTIYSTFASSRTWMNIIFVGGTCGLIDFFILGFEYTFCPSTAKKLQILLNQNNLDINKKDELPKEIKDKLDVYNDFIDEDNGDILIKETTQKNSNNKNDQLKLKSKGKNKVQNDDDINDLNKDKNNGSNNLDDSKKNTTIQKDLKNKYKNNIENKNVNNVESSNNIFETRQKYDNQNAKNTINSGNKSKDYLIDEGLNSNNQDLLKLGLKKNEDNHSKSALI